MVNLYSMHADGDGGMKDGSCPNRAESSPMNTTSRSLVLMNYFPDAPNLPAACKENSGPLESMLYTCHNASANRWPNFITVDFYKVRMLQNDVYFIKAKYISTFNIFLVCNI